MRVVGLSFPLALSRSGPGPARSWISPRPGPVRLKVWGRRVWVIARGPSGAPRTGRRGHGPTLDWPLPARTSRKPDRSRTSPGTADELRYYSLFLYFSLVSSGFIAGPAGSVRLWNAPRFSQVSCVRSSAAGPPSSRRCGR